MNVKDYIYVEAQFFFAPLEENEPLGKAISISFVDIFPKFNHKEKILKNFEENGLVLLDYEITYRPMKNSELNDYELDNVTKH